GLVRVQGFAPPIDGNLQSGPNMPEDVFSPIEGNRHVAPATALPEKSDRARREGEIEGLDSDAGESRERCANQDHAENEADKSDRAASAGRLRHRRTPVIPDVRDVLPCQNDERQDE